MSDIKFTPHAYEEFIRISFGFQSVTYRHRRDPYLADTSVRLNEFQLYHYRSLSETEINEKLVAAQDYLNDVTHGQNKYNGSLVAIEGDILTFSGSIIAAKAFFSDVFGK